MTSHRGIGGISRGAAQVLKAVFDCEQLSFGSIARAGGLDPACDFRGVDLRSWPLAGVDIRGVDFSNSDLRGTGIAEAIKDDTTNLEGALQDDQSPQLHLPALGEVSLPSYARIHPAERPLPPGSTIGILGSDELARMLALAAARLGLKTHVLDEETGPAFDVATRTSTASFNDTTALIAFAEQCGVVTWLSEQVPEQTITTLGNRVPLWPNVMSLGVVKDRLGEKVFLETQGIPTCAFHRIDGVEQLRSALKKIKTMAVLIPRKGNDEGGSIVAEPSADASMLWSKLGGQAATLEEIVPYQFEIALVVIRNGRGDLVYYDCTQTRRENGMLMRSFVPSELSEEEQNQARSIAGKIANLLEHIGAIAIEMYYAGVDVPLDQRLVVKAIVPRVHDTAHWTIDACATSQFENHARAVAGWPLGSATRRFDAETTNLVGAAALDWQRLAGEPDACLHLYGKREARPRRKMGHVTRLKGRGLTAQ